MGMFSAVFLMLLTVLASDVFAANRIVDCRYGQELPIDLGSNCHLHLIKLCEVDPKSGNEIPLPDQMYEVRSISAMRLFKIKKDELTAYYTLGGDVLAVLSKGKYTLIHMITGQVTPTDMEYLASVALSEDPGPANIVMWRTSNAVAGQPILAYRVGPNASVGEPIAGSDMRRMAYLTRGEYCDGSAFSAAVLAENYPSKIWSEKRRVALIGSADVTPAQTADENCAKFLQHLFVAKRIKDGRWQLISAKSGQPFEAEVTYASAEEAITDMSPALTRAYEKQQQTAKIENERKAAEAKAETELNARYEAARAKVRELQAKADFAGAAKYAELNLPAQEWGMAVISWIDVPLNELERVVSRMYASGLPTHMGALAPLGARLAAQRECDKIKPSQFELNGNYNYTMNYGPKRKSLQEIYADLSYAKQMYKPDLNERMVYDVRAGEWRNVHVSPGESAPTFINVPTAEEDAAARNQAGQSRVQAYYTCVAQAQLKN